MFKVTVTQTVTKTPDHGPWGIISQVGDKTNYNYLPAASVTVEEKVYEQSVEDLSLADLVSVVNRLALLQAKGDRRVDETP